MTRRSSSETEAKHPAVSNDSDSDENSVQMIWLINRK